MAQGTIEERIATLEAQVAQLTEQLQEKKKAESLPWYDQIFGTFKDDPIYEEAMRLGKEWRDSCRETHEENAT